jgi:hypothetical protein
MKGGKIMDVAFLSNLAVSTLAPILLKGVGELAGTTLKDAYEAIKDRLSRTPEEKQVVEKFEKGPVENSNEFQMLLSKHLEKDEELRTLLTTSLEKMKNPPVEMGNVNVNQIHAEKVIVAQKVDKIDMG